MAELPVMWGEWLAKCTSDEDNAEEIDSKWNRCQQSRQIEKEIIQFGLPFSAQTSKFDFN